MRHPLRDRASTYRPDVNAPLTTCQHEGPGRTEALALLDGNPAMETR